jgi:type III pantothenate kinase
MLSGMIFGFSGLTDAMIKKLKLKLGKNIPVIGTGGNIKFISSYCQEFTAIDINLTLKGLNLILTSTTA